MTRNMTRKIHVCLAFLRLSGIFNQLHMTRIEQFLLPQNRQEISASHQKRVIYFKREWILDAFLIN